MVSLKENSDNNFINNMSTIAKGVIISIICTLVLLFIFSIVLTYTNTNENTIPTVIIIITAISIFIGATLTAKAIKKNGIINGGIIALIYILLIYLGSSITSNTGFKLTMHSIIMIILSMAFGMIGGIIGVNSRLKKG